MATSSADLHKRLAKAEADIKALKEAGPAESPDVAALEARIEALEKMTVVMDRDLKEDEVPGPERFIAVGGWLFDRFDRWWHLKTETEVELWVDPWTMERSFAVTPEAAAQVPAGRMQTRR